MNRVLEAVGRHGRDRRRLLSILHEVQAGHPGNYLCPEDLAAAASALGMAVSEIRSIASFYTMFSFRPRGRHLVRVCESPPCHVMGATGVLEELRRVLGVREGETTADGMFTLEASSCLGLCGVAPAMMIDGESFGNLTPEGIRSVIDRFRARAEKERGAR